MNNYYDYPYQHSYTGPTSEKSSQIPVESYEGLIRGNLFEDLYKPYTNYEPFNLTPHDEQEALLQKVQEYNFADIDLNLYLDIYPDDQEKLQIFNKYKEEYKRAKELYESKYGPLTTDSKATSAYPWNWIKAPWPWEVM